MRAAHLAAATMVVGLVAVTIVSATTRPPMAAATTATTLSPDPPPAPLQPPDPSTTAATAGPETVVAGGLAAWGRFAVTGDLAELAPWFDPDGPQAALLAAEAEKLAAAPLGPPPYSVTMSGVLTERDGDEARVTGTVVFARSGEERQVFSWRVVLRSDGATWRIWTVEESSP